MALMIFGIDLACFVWSY